MKSFKICSVFLTSSNTGWNHFIYQKVITFLIYLFIQKTNAFLPLSSNACIRREKECRRHIWFKCYGQKIENNTKKNIYDAASLQIYLLQNICKIFKLMFFLVVKYNVEFIIYLLIFMNTSKAKTKPKQSQCAIYISVV